MIIELEDQEPIDVLRYLAAAPGGGRDEKGDRKIEERSLPIISGTISDFTCDLDYIIVTSDLQGNIDKNGEAILLGIGLADHLKLIFQIYYPEVDLNNVGVFLCGDLFARLDKRGGLGDVRHIWRAFNRHFGFVAGVEGNHDSYGNKREFEAFKLEKGIYYLNKEIKTIRGMKLAGCGGVIGRPTKPHRTEENEFLSVLGKLLHEQPDFLLMHEGPDNEIPKLSGNSKISEIVENSKRTTICCGHNHWPQTIVTKDNATQVMNVDAKCILLQIEH